MENGFLQCPICLSLDHTQANCPTTNRPLEPGPLINSTPNLTSHHTIQAYYILMTTLQLPLCVDYLMILSPLSRVYTTFWHLNKATSYPPLLPTTPPQLHKDLLAIESCIPATHDHPPPPYLCTTIVPPLGLTSFNIYQTDS